MKTLYRIYQDGQELEKNIADFLLCRTERQSLGVFSTLITRNVKQADNPQALVPTICALDYHIERLMSDAKARGLLNAELIEHTPVKIRLEALRSTASFVSSEGCFSNPFRIRLLLTKNGLEITVEKIIPRYSAEQSIKLATVIAERPTPGQKTTAIETSSKAYTFAQNAGANEALLIDEQGNVCEGAWSNIFWFERGRKLFTPKSNILPGVTRRIILENEDCIVTDIKLDELKNSAEELFITQTTTGITPVIDVDGQMFASDETNSRTLKLKRKLNLWLDAVSVAVNPQ